MILAFLIAFVGTLSAGTVSNPSVAAGSSRAAEGKELFGLSPLAGPFDRTDLDLVFVEGEDEWTKTETYRAYRDLAPPPEGMTTQSMLAVIRKVFERLEASPSFTTENGKAVRQRILNRLRLLSQSLGALDPSGHGWAAFRDIGMALWQPGDLDDHPSLMSKLTFFSDKKDEAFVLEAHEKREVQGENTDHTLVLTEYYTYVTAEEALEIRSAIDLIYFLIKREFPLGDIAVNLAANDQAWTNYLQRGYSQYPWEIALNSSLVSSSWDSAPYHQFVFLHPEPAFLVSAESADDAELQLAVLVHLVGYVKYFDFSGDRDLFLGVSTSLSLPEEDDLGLGYGGTLHFGAAALGSTLSYLSAGVFYQEGTDDLAVAVSVDAWKFLSNPDVGQLIGLFTN